LERLAPIAERPPTASACRAPIAERQTLLRLKAFAGPPWAGSRERQTVVNPEGMFLPELDPFRDESESSPESRPRYRLVAEARFNGGHVGFELSAGPNRGTLP
jgi:hypothetical protein